jgi:hypothetical protein
MSQTLDQKALEAAFQAIWGTESLEGRIATLGYSTAKVVAEQAITAYLDALPPPEGDVGELDPKLPCDVTLPPATTFRAGVSLSALLARPARPGNATPCANRRGGSGPEAQARRDGQPHRRGTGCTRKAGR